MNRIINICFVLSCSCLLSNCNKQEEILQPTIIVPPTNEPYSFFRAGEESVINIGQTVRQLLMQDIKILIESLAEPAAQPIDFGDLYRYYDNNRITIDVKSLTPTNRPPLISHYASIASGRDLKGKVLPQYLDEISADMQSWCQIIADNSYDPHKLGTKAVYIDENTGYDLAAFFQKTAYGAVAFSHALNGYFRDVEGKNNEDFIAFTNGFSNYTEMEHHMDETFGYFGAARVFKDFSLEEVADREGHRNYMDNYLVDGKIDFKTEYNFSFAVEAARRDLASHSSTAYALIIFEAFRLARKAIVDKDYTELLRQKTIILKNWEKVIASSAIHHLNSLLRELEKLAANPDTSPYSLYRHWSAMFKYTEALRYNYDNRLSNWEELLTAYMVTPAVPYPKALYADPSKITKYKERLLAARAIFQSTYNFAVEDVRVW